jgi:hypothetical protein
MPPAVSEKRNIGEQAYTPPVMLQDGKKQRKQRMG